MNRDALFKANRDIIAGYAARITRPDTKVIIVSEPVDLLTTSFAQKSALPANRVMGVGGILDATRLRYFIAAELKVSMGNVAAQVIGRHADDMIPLAEYCCVSGVSIDCFLSPEKISDLFEKTKNAGSLIVELAGRASAYYGPSAVTADLTEAICLNSGRILPVAHLLTGQFGIHGAALSLPAVIGKDGIMKTIEPRLDETQMKTFKASATLIQKIVKEAGHA